MEEFIEWVKSTPHYKNLIFMHGDKLFIRENGVFKILAIQLAYEAWTKNDMFRM